MRSEATISRSSPSSYSSRTLPEASRVRPVTPHRLVERPARTTAGNRGCRLEVVREVGEQLGAVLADDDQVLEADAAELLAVAAGLERDHVARHQRVGRAAEVGALVDLEPDAVPERVVVALVELHPGRLAALRRVAGVLE